MASYSVALLILLISCSYTFWYFRRKAYSKINIQNQAISLRKDISDFISDNYGDNYQLSVNGDCFLISFLVTDTENHSIKCAIKHITNTHKMWPHVISIELELFDDHKFITSNEITFSRAFDKRSLWQEKTIYEIQSNIDYLLSEFEKRQTY